MVSPLLGPLDEAGKGPERGMEGGRHRGREGEVERGRVEGVERRKKRTKTGIGEKEGKSVS